METRTKRTKRSSSWHEWLDYAGLRLLVGLVGTLPRPLARELGAAIGFTAFRCLTALRRRGRTNLELAYPAATAEVREQTLSDMYRSLGWQLAEFCQMRYYTRDKVSAFLRYEGLQHYLAARARGKGVLIVTGHLGAWELSSFYHSLMGFPMSVVARRLDNRRLDSFVNRIRTLHGNRVIDKDDFARGLLTAMAAGETVGILMDTNMTPPQGVFVPFFGRAAATASGLARVALRTGAAVLPGFLLWHADEQKYVLHFGEELTLIRTGDTAADTVTNTALFTSVIEQYIRRTPGQWLWVHRRWKTRPPEEEVQAP